MKRPVRDRLPSLLSLLVVAAACVGPLQARSTTPARDGAHDGAVALAPPALTIQSPTPGEVVQGVTIIRFRTENIRIGSPFLPADTRAGALPSGHLHVTVDGAPWHWVHATSDPVVVTPLPPGEHTVALELAGADHRPLDAQTVRFTVRARASAATDHAGHR